MGAEIRPLRESEWEAATRVAARAFIDEPFIIALYGPDRLERFGHCLARFGHAPWPDPELVLGALIGEVVVGMVVVAPPGSCYSCREVERPDDPLELLDWNFYNDCRRAHEPQGDHAWLGKLAVEPVLRGTGLGIALLRAGAEASEDMAPTLLLECEEHRRALYERAGFRQVDVIPDEIGPPALLMRREATAAAGPGRR